MKRIVNLEDLIVQDKTEYLLIPCDNNDEFGYNGTITHLLVKLNVPLFKEWMYSTRFASKKQEYYKTCFWHSEITPIDLSEKISEDINSYKDPVYLFIKNQEDEDVIKNIKSVTSIAICTATIYNKTIYFSCYNKYNSSIEYYTDDFFIDEL